MKKIILMMAIFSISFVSCKKDDDSSNDNNTPATATNFTNVKQGAVWTYVNSDSNPDDAGITFESSYTVTAKDANGWCNVSWTMPGYTIPVEWYVDNNEWADTGNKTAGEKFTLVKANPVLNDVYSRTYTVNDTQITNTRRVTKLNQSVTVPAGTFTNCVVIHETTTDDPIYYKDYWIDLNAGIIRTEGTTAEDYPVLLITELKSKNF